MPFSKYGNISTWFGNSEGSLLPNPVVGTVSLTADTCVKDLTINGTLNTAGYRLYVRGTLTISAAGSILNNGSTPTAPNFHLGAAGAAEAILGGGTAGGDGRTGGAGVGSTGTDNADEESSLGGKGGTGGQAGAQAGGTGGLYYRVNWDGALAGNEMQPFLALYGYAMGVASGTLVPTIYKVWGGTGGGGGGADGVGCSGGGGGGGGGIIYIASPNIVIQNGGKIQAKGGAGGVATGAINNAGGGGGGGGGVIILHTNRLEIADSTSAIDVTGGAGGTEYGTGNPGSSGGSGSILIFSERGNYIYNTTGKLTDGNGEYPKNTDE